MKKFILLSIFSSAIVFSNPLNAEEFKFEQKPLQPVLTINSQKQTSDDNGVKGKVIIGANAGFNVFATLLTARYYLSDYYDFDGYISSAKASPLFHLSVDYGFARKFSAGVDFGYQNARIDVSSYGSTFTDSWNRILLAARGDYHIIAKENMSLYTGLKLGYNMYTVNSTASEKDLPGYTSRLGVNPQATSVQAHFGYSYFFRGKLGVNAEVGIGFGGPYLFSAGLAYKI
ncbi:MAG: hypothetical protein K0Q95_444 [Bacteroidota bacterium]|jgi:hypothetical protein|nr:hypothetical protein [Bacteroidota bacterium]